MKFGNRAIDWGASQFELRKVSAVKKINCTMKIIHILSWYLPHSSGGTEVYVDGLVQGLRSQGIESLVAASINGKQEQSYQHNGVEVYRYPVFPNPTPAKLDELEEHGGFEYFFSWLKTHKSEIYHQHSWRFGCGLLHLALAKKLGMKTVVTAHMPEPLCLRGTMMLHGQQPCDGRIQENRCSQCLGTTSKVPAWATQIFSRVPLSVATAAQTKLKASKNVRLRQLGRVIGMAPQVTHHRRKLQEMAQLADIIIAPCQWIYDALLVNGLPKEKIILCRQGVSSFDIPVKEQPQLDKPLKIGFLGRWQETKGIQVLAEAVHGLPKDVPVELIIHGMVHGNADRENRDRVLALAALDYRIQVAEKLSRQEVPKALAEFDILAVPSQWLETGPLVVLEAYYVGTPVMGSDRGGIAELVHHGIDGWLVPAADVEAWQEAIAHLALNQDLVAKFSQAIKPVRTMKQVANEMAVIYQKMLTQTGTGSKFHN